MSLMQIPLMHCFDSYAPPLEIAGNDLGHHKIEIKPHYLNLSSMPSRITLDYNLTSPVLGLKTTSGVSCTLS